MIYRKIHDEIYGADMLFFSGCPIEVAQKKTHRVFKIKDELKVESSDAAAIFICDTGSKLVYIIWIQKSRDIPSITHECTHLVYEIFKDRGIPLDYKNQESVAYYLGFWVESILGGKWAKPAKVLKSKKR